MISDYVLFGYACGGFAAGVIVAHFIEPMITAAKDIAGTAKALKSLLSLTVFGSGLFACFAFRYIHGADAPTIWASYLIGFAIGLVAGIVYVDVKNRSFRRRTTNLPPQSLTAIRQLLTGESRQNDPDFVKEVEEALDSLEPGDEKAHDSQSADGLCDHDQ